MNILGLNAYHGDSSACLVVDGKLVCALEEERIRRVKHWAGLPTEAIKWCLEYAGLGIQEIDCIAVSRDPSAHLYKKLLRVLKKSPSLGFLKERLSNTARIGDIKSDVAQAFGLSPGTLKAVVHNVEHHRAHIASAYMVSPFEEAVCISVDGFGDFASTMRGIGRGNNVDIIDWVEFPHSLGIFYTALTQFLGFWKYGDEYKIMGLSAAGSPAYMNEMRKIVKLNDKGLFQLDTSYFLHDKEGVAMIWKGGEPAIGRLFSDKLTALFGSPREKEDDITTHHQDIAASVQAVYEEAFFHILNNTRKLYRVDRLALAGGCIQNSLANGKIIDKTPFTEVYIQPASYDAGTAIGAAFWIWNIVERKERSFIMESPYWGPGFTDAEIESVLKAEGIHYTRMSTEELYRQTARAIVEGKIVGWFQGRTEWGPRALGNRSILVDPRNKEMKNILNKRIKRREGFRPFAPSILEEQTTEWFEHSSPVPFMEKVYMIKAEKRSLIPAVSHLDGTGRLQTICRRINDRYYGLIEEFFRLTGVPMLLNTSFNENEPIVSTPTDALNCFLRTKMDLLVLGDFFIKSPAS